MSLLRKDKEDSNVQFTIESLGISARNISGNWKDALLTDRMPRIICRGTASIKVIVPSL